MTTQQIDARLAQLGITYTSFEVFMAYAKDAGNWAGTPCIGGNVGGGRQERGNLNAGKAFAQEMGVEID